MAGYRSGGTDFDALFAPGTGPTAPNLRAGGAPLQYAPLSAGTKRADVGYRVGGSDVSNLWAAAGSVSNRLPFDGQTLAAGITALSGETGTITATANFTMQANGQYEARAFGRGQSVVQFSGTWLPAGAPVSDFEILFVISNVSGDAPAPSNGAPSYVSASTARTVSRAASVDASTSNNVLGGMTVTVRVRRISTGQVLEGQLNMTVNALGQV